MRSILVLGGQWGDEGKGKIVDIFAGQVDHVVRTQGGANAGHTVLVADKEYKLHLVPSGIIHKHAQCHIAAGVVVDVGALLEEVDILKKAGVDTTGRLWLSARAHMVLPYHKQLDSLMERQRGDYAVGTTGRGIGPCHADKANRLGFRLGELRNLPSFLPRLRTAIAEKNQWITQIYGGEPIDAEEVETTLLKQAGRISSSIKDVESHLALAVERGEKVLLEGAQGSLLDLDFGTYPFVTSSHTLASGICHGAGWGMCPASHILGVFKAYATRVGEGPFPTEATGVVSDDRRKIREIGTTTGRERRVGWFDAVLARYTARLNGVTSLAITKLDVLDRQTEICVCVAYERDGVPVTDLPCTNLEWAGIQPVYRTFPGWCKDTKLARTFDELPPNAQAYVQGISELLCVPLSLISIGPEREQTIFLPSLLTEEVVCQKIER